MEKHPEFKLYRVSRVTSLYKWQITLKAPTFYVITLYNTLMFFTLQRYLIRSELALLYSAPHFTPEKCPEKPPQKQAKKPFFTNLP